MAEKSIDEYNNQHQCISVDLGHRSYDIHVGQGILANLARLIPVSLKNRKVFFVSDENVQSYVQSVTSVIKSAGVSLVKNRILPSGEGTKAFSYVEDVCNWMLSNGVDRQSILIAIGGGVTGDLAGFCAAITLRGIPFVQIPTTLLSQVDSSVGGKTGINTKYGKNLIGSFYQPISVVVDTDVLKTLPKREVKAGYAEIIKYALINDDEFFEWLDENASDLLDLKQEALIHAIVTSIRSKADIVKKDEREQGVRVLLNLGHTFAHALEAECGYDGRLLHGEAVSIGLVMAFDLSQRLGLCDITDYDLVVDHLKKVGLPVDTKAIQSLNTTPEALYAHMGQDKKVDRGLIRFVLTKGIGKAFLMTEYVDRALVLDVLRTSLPE